jgi:hypothetical protein
MPFFRMNVHLDNTLSVRWLSGGERVDAVTDLRTSACYSLGLILCCESFERLALPIVTQMGAGKHRIVREKVLDKYG